MLALGYHWLVAGQDLVSGPDTWVRVGLRQGASRVELTCKAGLQVQDAAGATLFEGAEAITLRAGTAPPAAPAPPEGTGGDAPENGASPAPAGDKEAQDTPETGTPAGRQEPLESGSPASQEPAPEPRPTLAPGQRCLILNAGERTATLPRALVKVRAADGETPISLGRSRYRGVVVVEPDSRGRLTVVNSLPLEEYVRGVVASEIEASAPAAALEAQAVVARTYAVSCLKRHAAQGYDLCDSIHCQVYRGAAGERESTDRAVAATRGRILRHEGRPICAYFHSTCGGITDSPAHVWGSEPGAPYLAGVADREAARSEGLRGEPDILALTVSPGEVFCGQSPEFAWEFERTREELERLLQRTLPVVLGKRVLLGRLQGLVVSGRTPSGRAAALIVQGSNGAHMVRGDSMRWLFGTGRAGAEGLRSTRFVIRPTTDPNAADPAPVRYRFVGLGWGHGIGLCQSGAIGMARRGYSTARIL